MTYFNRRATSISFLLAIFLNCATSKKVSAKTFLESVEAQYDRIFKQETQADKVWEKLDQVRFEYRLIPEDRQMIFDLQRRLEDQIPLFSIYGEEVDMAEQTDRLFDQYNFSHSAADFDHYKN